MHVRDVAAANVLALTTDPPAGGGTAVNVAPVSPTPSATWRARSPRRPHAPQPEVVGGARLGDVRHVVAVPARPAALLGFRAAARFAAGVRGFAADPLRAPARTVDVTER